MIKISTLRLTNEGISLTGEEPSSLLGADDELLAFDHPVSYRLHASLVNNGALVTGEVETMVSCTCVRCLDTQPVLFKNSDVCHFYENPLPSELDLTDDIREDILIILPQNVVCSDDCKGMCLTCGQNLNEKACNCDTTSSSDDIWSELDRLRC